MSKNERMEPLQIRGPDDLVENVLVAEVGQFFRQSDDTIRKWIKEGKFPNAYKLGKYLYIPKQDVLDLAHKMYGKR